MNERDYWDARYRAGKNSGHQSHRDWEHSVIKMYVPDYDAVSWLDVGCGDLAFWDGIPPIHYLGIDFAESLQERVKNGRVLIRDATASALQIPPHDVVLCLNVVYHILDEQRIGPLMLNLGDWARDYLFISNWIAEPTTYDDRYQRYHNIEPILPLTYDFQLLAQHYHGNFVMYVLGRERQ